MANLIANPSFETNTTGWDTNNSFYTNTGATLTRITTDSQSGTACARVVTTASSNQQGINVRGTAITFAPNTTYDIWAYVRWKSGQPVRLRVREANGGSGAITASSDFTSVDAWTKLSFRITSGANAGAHANNLLSLATDLTAEVSEFYVDNVVIQDVTSATAGHVSVSVSAAINTRARPPQVTASVSLSNPTIDAGERANVNSPSDASVSVSQPSKAIRISAEAIG